MKSNVPCKYFYNDGYCGKGKYCEFLHGEKTCRKACKFFTTPQGCSRGKQCMFAHDRHGAKDKSSITTAIGVSAAAPILAPAIETIRQANDDGPKNTMSTLWGFDDDNDEGIYFYGASGTANFDRRRENRRYSEIVGNECGRNVIDNHFQEPLHKMTVCPFYLSGSCRFGNACRNIHSSGNDIGDSVPVDVRVDSLSEEALLLQEEMKACSEAECGICLTALGDRSRGLMSHCTCVFCLECIRSWRKEGVEIAKSSQVRLCPLCRQESFFIIPCKRVITDPERKRQLVDQYKQSLGNITCKHFMSGTCPFGSSCFYQHMHPDGTVEETMPPRIVFNGISAAEAEGGSTPTGTYVSGNMLGDYVATQLSARIRR